MLITAPNLTRPDDSYARLIATHDGLTEAESHALNARLLLRDGKIDEAVAAMKKSLELDPKGPLAEETRETLKALKR